MIIGVEEEVEVVGSGEEVGEGKGWTQINKAVHFFSFFFLVTAAASSSHCLGSISINTGFSLSVKAKYLDEHQTQLQRVDVH